MIPDCKCFKEDMRGEDNSILTALAVEESFAEAMAYYNMCPASGRYVALTSIVPMLRRIALVEYRARNEDYRRVEDLDAMDSERFNQIEREGFADMMKTMVADLTEREGQIELKNQMSTKDTRQ